MKYNSGKKKAGKAISLGFVCFIMIFYYLNSQAQIDSIRGRLQCMYSGSEKVFMQLNKDTYVSGEEVLFSACLLKGPDFRPDTFCKVLYIVLNNSCNQKIIGFRLNLHQGVCQGYFVLPDTIATGYYNVSAFTNNMRNFDHDLYFTRRVFVGNQGDEKLNSYVSDEPRNGDAGLAVYPESGKLLAGIHNRVVILFPGFRGGAGQKAEIFGDSSGLISAVPLSAGGMGEISITPSPGEKYYARLQNREYPFNIIPTTGYILKALLNVNRDIDVIIQTNIKSVDPAPLRLVCYSERSGAFDIPIYIRDNSAQVTLPAVKTGSGIVHLCLISASMDLLCERLIYRPDPSPGILIQMKPGTFGPRQKVQIALSLPSYSGLPGTIQLSAHVSQKSPLSSYGISGIQNALSVFSEFGNNGTEMLRNDSITERMIDQFMISHTSPGYSWECVLEKSKPVCRFLPENNGYILAGKLVTKANNPVPGACIYLSAPDSFVNLKYCYTDNYGRFLFRLDKFYDNKNLVLQATGNDIPEGARIEPENKYNDETQKPSVIREMPGDLRNYILLSRSISLVNKVYKPLFIRPIASGKPQTQIHGDFYGHPDETIFTSDYSALENFSEIARNLLQGIIYSGNTHKVRVMDVPAQKMMKEDAMLFLNNIPFPDPVVVSKLDSRLIRKIDLKKDHLLYGENNMYGIIAITTNQKDVYALDASLTSFVFSNSVNDIPVVVSGPGYAGNISDTGNLPDFRQTLYWNPAIEIENGQATLEFYTSDIKGKFTIEVEGIAPDGRVLSGEALIEVK